MDADNTNQVLAWRSQIVSPARFCLTQTILCNSLVNIYGLTSSREGDSIDTLDCKGKPAIEFAPQVAMYSACVFLTESVGRHDTQNSSARSLLHELELPNVYKRIIMHIQSSP